MRALEARIETGEFDARPIDDALIEHLHRRLCAELTPQLTGWRHINVVVGAHTAPDFYRVPSLVREYARDLEARLLSIHPFADFNGRLTRVLLLRRLDLPWVALVPTAGEGRAYLNALSAADRND